MTYRWHGQGLFTMENAFIMYLSIVLDTVLWESSRKITFKIFNFLLIWDKNLESHTG